VLLDEDLAEGAVLAEQDGLQADQFQQRQEHGDQRALGAGVAEQAAQGHGLVFHGEAAGEELDHLADGDGVFLHVEDGAVAGALQNVAEDAHQVDGVGGDLRLGAGIVLELAEAGVGPGGGFEHLLLLQHLGGVLEALVLQQPLDQLAARIFGGSSGPEGARGSSILLLMWMSSEAV
jgi:hypothetical protein